MNALTLQQQLKKSASDYGDLPALSFVDQDPLSYKDLESLVHGISGALHRRGIEPGNKVVILSENMPNWGAAYFGINRCGAVNVPILPDFSAADIANIIDHSEAIALFVSKRSWPKLELTENLNKLHIFILDDLTALPDPAAGFLSNLFSKRVEKKQGVLELPEEREPLLMENEEDFSYPVKEDDLACIIYTSGTTGSSKGVMLTNKNLVWDARAANDIPGIRPGDRLVSILPMAHTYEFTIGFLVPLVSGAGVYYLKRPPSATVLMPALRKIRPQFMLSVPLLIEKIYRQNVAKKFKEKALLRTLMKVGFMRKMLNKAAGNKLKKAFGGRLRFFGIGGAPLAPEVEDFLREAGFPYAMGYGLTETSPLLAGADAKHTRRRSTGAVLPGVEIKIEETENREDAGEIVARGPNVMLGYYKDPEKTREVLSEDGWFRTGDLGYLDDDNYLYIRGRIKNMILGPSGENIYPEAIEALINSFDHVEESVVFQESGKLLARVHINYDAMKEQMQSMAEGASQAPEAVRKYISQLLKEVNQRLSHFSRISEIIEQPEPFEKTPTKKIKRFLYDKLHIGPDPDAPSKKDDARESEKPGASEEE